MTTNNTNHECVFIAISETNGGVSFLQFNTRMTVGSLQKHEAEPIGFSLSADGLFWEREPSEENIEKHMQFELLPTKNRYFQEVIQRGDALTSRRVVQAADIPQDRAHRDAWKDDGSAIVHDMEKVAAIDEKRRLDAAVKDAIKDQHDALVASVTASLKQPQ